MPDILSVIGTVVAALMAVVELVNDAADDVKQRHKRVCEFATFIKDVVEVLNGLGTRVLNQAAQEAAQKLTLVAREAETKCKKYLARGFIEAAYYAKSERKRCDEFKVRVRDYLTLITAAQAGRTVAQGVPVPPPDCQVQVHTPQVETFRITAEEQKLWVRTNNSNYAEVVMSERFAEGSFKFVYLGTYKIGERKGEPCVCKVFKDGPKWDAAYFSIELEVVKRALEFVSLFNRCNKDGLVADRPIILNQPEVWTFMPGSSHAGQMLLLEPMIPRFEKFNSNTGYTDEQDKPWHPVMQSLSHFSYHQSNGEYLLCDLQGGVSRKGVVLTDPVIMSRSKKYGPTDLGPLGISTFFHYHKCTDFCQEGWLKPKDMNAYLPREKGSSMMTAQELDAEEARRAAGRPAMPPIGE